MLAISHEGILLSGCLSVRVSVIIYLNCANDVLHAACGNSQHTYNFDAVSDIDELITFWDQTVKGRGHD